MRKKTDKTTDKTEVKPKAAKPLGVVVAGVDLRALVWADAEAGRKMIAALSKRYDESLKTLIPLLSEKNDDATVQASFALDGMTMAALAPDMEKRAVQLCVALADNFKLAKDDTARCILLKCMDQLCASVFIDNKDFFKCVGKCLASGEPLFTYALNVLRRCSDSDEAMAQLFKATKKADASKKAILYAAIMENSSDNGWKYVLECFDFARSLKGKPELFRMLCAALASRGDVIVVDQLLQMFASRSRIDKGQARRAFLNLCFLCDDYDDYDDYDDDCDDDDCGCDCDDDDCGCQLPTEKVARLFASLEPLEPALLGLMSTLGDTEETFEILWDCVVNGDQILRLTALKYLAGGFEKMVWTERLVERAMALKSAEAKADAVRMFGKRGDIAARPYVLSCLRDKSPLVRQAALEAAACFPGDNVGGGRLGGVVLA